jgi:hypothetical protein
VLTYVAQYEVLPFYLKGDPKRSAGAGLPDLCGALDALDPQGWISQIISHLAKRLLDSLLILLRKGAVPAPETLGNEQAH